MIEAEELPTKKSLENLKDDAVFLLNDEEKIKNDQKIEKNKVDGRYENTAIEFKKWSSLIKKFVDRNIKVLSITELDAVRLENGGIINSSEISTGLDDINDVWNQSDNETFLDKKRTKSNRIFLTGDDIRLMVSRKLSNKWNVTFHTTN